MATELEDFVYQLEMVQDQHIEALKNANLSDPIRFDFFNFFGTYRFSQ